MSSLQSLIDQVDDSINEIIHMNQELIKIPSINTGYMPTGIETLVAEFLNKL